MSPDEAVRAKRLRNVLDRNVETPIASRQPRHNSQNLKDMQFANRLEPGKHAVMPLTVEALEHESKDSLNGTGSPVWLLTRQCERKP